MKLYPHNQKAYEEARKRLLYSDRTCIIHPTGTGKSLIIAKFMEDNKDKKHLLLAPGMHMRDEVQKHTSVPFYFSTYHSLVHSDSSLAFIETGYDFIYLDEFHRIGAEKWGERVLEVIDLNSSAKIIGTSATPIRYLDDHRDMSKEIFRGNIASAMSLFKAISIGIHRQPKYVSALYSLSDDSEEAIRKIKWSDHPDKDGLIERIKACVVDWEKSGGIDSILKKHLPSDRRKIIVFCKSRHHMGQAKKILLPTLQVIWGEVEAIEVYSEFGRKKNNLALEEFSEPSGTGKVLFTIDKLNEGLHVKGVDTIIMMRDTMSPIIYYQQIGRCFSVGQEKNPLIFDFVNNFRSIKINEFKDELEREMGAVSRVSEQELSDSEKFEIGFFDETKHWQEVFEDILWQVDDWEVMYEEAKRYYDTYGGFIGVHSINKKLGNWLRYQSKEYAKGRLDKKNAEKLDKALPGWNISLRDKQWLDKLQMAVPIIKNRLDFKLKKSEWSTLNRWIESQKILFRKGMLSRDKVSAMEELGIDWRTKHEIAFDANLKSLEDYISHYGRLPTLRENKRLAGFVVNTKQNIRNNTISKDRIKKFSQLISPENHFERIFKIRVKELSEFVSKYNRLPKKSEDKCLYNWIMDKKKLWGRLNEEKRNQLLALGVSPSRNDS